MGGVVRHGGYQDEDAYAIGLLRRVRLRDRAAMERFYGLFQEAVYRMALVRLGQPAAAAHVLQDLMLQVWSGTHAWRPGLRPRAWILQLAARATRTQAADVRDEEERIDPSTDAIATDPARPDPASNLHTALRALPARYRAVLHLAYFEHLPDTEIARVLDLPVTAVAWNRRQGRDALSAMFGGNGACEARARDLFLDAWMRRELRTVPDASPCDFGLDRLQVQMRIADRERRVRQWVRSWLRRPFGRIRRWVRWAAPTRRATALG